MSTPKTVIVVGAGASNEAHFPTGHELKQKIASLLDIKIDQLFNPNSGDQLIYQALRTETHLSGVPPQDVKHYLAAADTIRDAMPLVSSIDDFLDKRQGDKKIELCGKLAIVRAILKAEQGSLLYCDWRDPGSKPNFTSLETSWFANLFKGLTANCRRSDLEARMKAIGLIVFNYDRCIEHSLFHSLQRVYDVTEGEAASLVNGMAIYHPYGTVGSLPWQSVKSSESSIVFGGEPSVAQLLTLSRSIKTYTESTDPNSSDIVTVRELLQSAKTAIFLGFSFLEPNLKLLAPNDKAEGKTDERKYFGTAYKISDANCNLIRVELSRLAGVNRENIFLRQDSKCSQLFHEFGRQIVQAFQS